ncbi:MAG TPA: FAD-dependent oxidoreductase, partial [Acidimicrobiales bacterium]|nr:FAD-dependent oxidoreductase [Acidimicrobiales bacterium]
AGWQRLNAELVAAGASPVTMHHPGSLVVGWSAGDRAAVRRFAQVAAQVGAPASPVDRDGDPELFADLSDRVRDGLYLPEDAWLDPDDAVSSLRDGLARTGAREVSDRVVAVSRDDAGVVARGEHGEYRGDVGVIATGAADVPEGCRTSGRHAVRPVRGATVRLRGVDREGRVMVRAFVRGRPIYLVGRAGRDALLGATAEERREPGVEVGELARLLRDALDVLPGLESATVVETRSGLRPASVDGRAFIEEVEPLGWVWTSGHYRHGITLAPDAADRVVAFAETS